MALLSPRLAAQLHARTEVGTYGDQANLIVRPTGGTQNAAGHYTGGESIIPMSCSFTDKPSQELWRDIDIRNISAEIRFSSVSPTKGDQVELVSRAGQALQRPTMRFEIVDILDRGTFGFVCALKAIER